MSARLNWLAFSLGLGLMLAACGGPPTPAATPTNAPVPPAVWTQIVGTATALRLTASAPGGIPAEPSVTPGAPALAGTPASAASPATASPATAARPSSATPEPAGQQPTPFPPAPATATSAPAGGEPPTWTPDPAATPFIWNFTVNKVYDVVPGDTLRLEWTTQNALTVTLVHALSNGMLGGLGRADLPAAGALDLVTDGRARNSQQFMLTAHNAAGASIPTTIYVHFRCPYAFFFAPAPEYCPDGPAQTRTVVEQAFEGGRLPWIPNEGGAVIYALFPDGQVYGAADLWSAGQPESDPALTPPAGRFQPVRGFGKFWRETAWVRERLGWALAPEQSYDTLYQEETGGIDWKGWNYFVRSADGRVLHLTGHYVTYSWRYLD